MDLSEQAVYTSRLVDAGRTWIMLKKVICLAITCFWTKIRELSFICTEGHLLLAYAIMIIVLFVSGRSTSQNDLGSPRVPGCYEAPLWYRLQAIEG